MTITQVDAASQQAETDQRFDLFDLMNRIETIMVDIEIAWIIKLRK